MRDDFERAVLTIIEYVLQGMKRTRKGDLALAHIDLMDAFRRMRDAADAAHNRTFSTREGAEDHLRIEKLEESVEKLAATKADAGFLAELIGRVHELEGKVRELACRPDFTERIAMLEGAVRGLDARTEGLA